jgi:hypothetical protein
MTFHWEVGLPMRSDSCADPKGLFHRQGVEAPPVQIPEPKRLATDRVFPLVELHDRQNALESARNKDFAGVVYVIDGVSPKT